MNFLAIVLPYPSLYQHLTGLVTFVLGTEIVQDLVLMHASKSSDSCQGIVCAFAQSAWGCHKLTQRFWMAMLERFLGRPECVALYSHLEFWFLTDPYWPKLLIHLCTTLTAGDLVVSNRWKISRFKSLNEQCFWWCCTQKNALFDGPGHLECFSICEPINICCGNESSILFSSKILTNNFRTSFFWNTRITIFFNFDQEYQNVNTY